MAVPLLLTSQADEKVAGLQFDLNFDPTVFSIAAVLPGASATQAGKLVSTNPVAAGRLRVIVAGLNQTPIPDGELLGFTVQVGVGAASGRYELALSGLVLSDPAGQRVPGELTAPVLLVGGDLPPEPPGPACGCTPSGGANAPASAALPAVLAVLVLIAASGSRRG